MKVAYERFKMAADKTFTVISVAGFTTWFFVCIALTFVWMGHTATPQKFPWSVTAVIRDYWPWSLSVAGVVASVFLWESWKDYRLKAIAIKSNESKENKRARLSGWNRLGIVTSAIWTLGILACSGDAGMSEANYASTKLNACLLAAPRNTDPCWNTFHTDYSQGMNEHWITVAMYVFMPIISAWVFVYAARFIIRWIWAGFRRKTA